MVNPGRPGGGGEYPLQDGFGWTNGVTRELLTLYPEDVAYRSPEQCPALPGAELRGTLITLIPPGPAT